MRRVIGAGLVAVLAMSAADSPAAAPGRFEADGVSLAYTVEGRGEPVLLIHGLYSSVRRNWELPGTLQLLAADHEVIALDLPGHGQSDKPDRIDAYGLQMVEDVVLLLDHLKIQKVHVVGYSMGGMIAMKLMATHPDRVSSAVIGGMGWMQQGTLLALFWERWENGGRGQTPAVCAQSLGRLALSADELKSINVPVTVVIGDQDPVKKLFVDPLAQARPDWPVVVVPNANHTQCVVRPEFKQAVVAALNSAPHGSVPAGSAPDIRK